MFRKEKSRKRWIRFFPRKGRFLDFHLVIGNLVIWVVWLKEYPLDPGPDMHRKWKKE